MFRLFHKQMPLNKSSSGRDAEMDVSTASDAHARSRSAKKKLKSNHDKKEDKKDKKDKKTPKLGAKRDPPSPTLSPVESDSANVPQAPPTESPGSASGGSLKPPPPSSRPSGTSDPAPIDPLIAAISEMHLASEGRITFKVDGIATDVKGLRQDVINITNDVKGLKLDVMDIRQEVSVLGVKAKEHDETFSLFDERLSCLEVSNKELRARLAIAESAEPAPLQKSFEFDRAPDCSIIKINTKSNVSKEAVNKALLRTVEKANVDVKSFTLKGKAIDRWFVASFKGTPDISQRNVRSTLDSLRNEDGHWERVLVDDVSLDSQGRPLQVQIFLGPDKSKKQVKTEVLTKKLGGILFDLGIKDIDTRRFKGEVLASWQPLAMVQVNGPQETEILWDAVYRDSLGIDKERVRALLLADSPTRSSPIQWSS